MQARQGPARPDGFGLNHPWDPVHSNQTTAPPCLAYNNPEHKLGLYEKSTGNELGGGRFRGRGGRPRGCRPIKLRRIPFQPLRILLVVSRGR